MSTNANLRKADGAKNDEFYTQLVDIEAELRHYKEQLAGKIVFCNCDDPFESNFFKYFAMNFNFLRLKKLIATCYDPSPIAYTQLCLFDDGKTVPNKNRHAYKIEITEVGDYNGDGRGVRGTSERGGHRGDQSALFPLPRVCGATDRVQ